MTPAPEDVAMAALRTLVAAVVREELARQHPAADAPPELLSIEEAARRLGIGRTACYGLIESGELPSIKLGKRRLISAAAVHDLAERGRP